MKRQAFLGRHFQFCSMKLMLFFFLSSLVIQDVSPTGILDCEISAQKCQPPFQTITVTPKDSKVTLNCSIKNGGKVQDMTWQDLEKHLNASDVGLFLQQIDSKNRSQPRECFSIKYAIPVKRVSKTSSPVDYYPDTREMELKCTFKGWPRPRVVWYNPDNKQIINGSEGFYISEQLVGKDTLRSILRNANIQEKHEGAAYKCTGMNNMTGWSSKKSGYIDLNYRCLLPKAPQISSLEVSEIAYLNVSLKCKVGVRPSDCWDNSLRWYFNNNSEKLESGEKYNIQERKTNTRCKTDFILTIINVTEADEGKYKCQWLCENDYPSFSRSSIIQLKVFPPSEEDPSTPSTQKITNSTSTAPSDTEAATTGQGNSKSADKWIPAIAILTSALALFLILFTAYHFIGKKSGRGYCAWYKMTSDHLSSKENH
ncbi:hypothetical protein ABFA07_013220 [Porites harrisoni]